jgi:hypothetical protein
MPRSSRIRLDLTIVFAVAVIANFVYLYFSNGDFYYPDSFTYLAPARSLLQGLGFLDDTHAIETLRTPAYPLLLALLGARTLPLIVLQHLLNALLALGIYLFVIGRTGNRQAALIAALLFSVDVPTIHYANKVLTETLFTFLLYVVFVLALQRPRPIVLGILTGILVLVRPVALFYFIALAFFFVLQRIPVRQIVIFVAVALVLPVGWVVRNRVQTGVFTLSSVGGFNMLVYRAAGALAIENEGNFHKELAEEQEGLREDADDEIQASLHIQDAEDLPGAIRARYYSRFAWRIIRQHPIAFVQLTIRGFLVNLFDSDWDAIEVVSALSPDVLQVAIGAVPIIVFVLASVGTILLWRTDRAMAILIVLTVLYFIGMAAGGEAESRFRVPVMPQIAIAAAMGVEAIRRGLRAHAVRSYDTHRDEPGSSEVDRPFADRALRAVTGARQRLAPRSVASARSIPSRQRIPVLRAGPGSRSRGKRIAHNADRV